METIRALLLRDKAVKAAVEKGLIKTTTSVLSTTTLCWKSNTAITATCTGRKKRFIELGIQESFKN